MILRKEPTMPDLSYRVTSDDPELQVIEVIRIALASMPRDARPRVIQYIRERDEADRA